MDRYENQGDAAGRSDAAGGSPSSGTGGSGYSGTTGAGSTGAGSTGSGTGSHGYAEPTTGTGATSGSTSADDFDRLETGYYRRHYEAHPAAATVGTYDRARRGYAVGHRAAANPTYRGRTFTEVEVDLRKDYGEDKEGAFETVRDFARHAFEWKTVLGGIALAVGGWWAGHKLYDALSELNEEDERDCRTFYDSHPARTSVSYDQARTGYALGYTAARNPDYAGRGFDDVETDLRTGFTGAHAETYVPLRDFTRRGYERGLNRTGGGGAV